MRGNKGGHPYRTDVIDGQDVESRIEDHDGCRHVYRAATIGRSQEKLGRICTVGSTMYGFRAGGEDAGVYAPRGGLVSLLTSLVRGIHE